MSLVIGFGYIRASPDSVLGELSRGMLVFCRVVSIAVQVADDGVDLNDDVLEMRILFNELNKNI